MIDSKLIPVQTLLTLLNQLPSTFQVGARTIADTGNLTVHNESGVQVGVIDFRDWAVELFVDLKE